MEHDNYRHEDYEDAVVRILVACEFSGVVRDAFSALGHDAWSCDLLPSEREGKHIQGDVLALIQGSKFETTIDQQWDLMIRLAPILQLVGRDGLTARKINNNLR